MRRQVLSAKVGLGYQKIAEREKNVWNMICKNKPAKVYSVPGTRDSKWILVMPYIHPIPAGERKGLLEGGINGKLGKAFRELASKKLFYTDEDIRWHHVGYSSSSKEEIRLCDFGHLKGIEPKDVEGCVQGALNILQLRSQTKDIAFICENHLEGSR